VADPVREVLDRLTPTVQAAAGSGELSRVADELFDFAAVLGRELRLRRALSDVSLPPEAKRGLLGALLAGTSASTRALLDSLVTGPQRFRPPILVDAVEQLAAVALFTATETDGTLDDVEDQLFRFARLVEREPALRAALTDPGLPDDRKVALLDELLASRGEPATLRLVRSAVLNPRGRAIERVLEDLARQAAAHRGRVIGEVISATPIDDERLERMAAALEGIQGRPVRLQVIVDPSIIGGVIVRIGDKIIDGSVRRQLERARIQLA
jgi:F-type H+-transporting ATPase subunit delta